MSPGWGCGTGQSGIPWSPLYRSFVGPWAAVDYVPLWQPAEARTQVLQLRPGAAD